MWETLILAGLVLAGTAAAAEKSQTVAVIKEWKGFNAAQEAPKRVVVKDQKGWEEVWTGMEGNVNPKPETPKVDFDSRMVIAVFMGTRKSGGYSVKITSIEQNGKVTVKVKESSPPPDAIVTMALTSPYHVVVVPKSDKPVEFINEK
jgi:hypothetical protein